MLRQLLRCALALALWGTVAAVGQAAITQEGGVSITPGVVQVGLVAAAQEVPVISDGKLWVTASSALVSNSLTIGSPTGFLVATGTVYIQGGTSTQTEGVHVGPGGNGRLQISEGGVVTSSLVRIGGDGSSNNQMSPQGIVRVDGVGTVLRSPNVTVGDRSDGQLFIAAGGSVLSPWDTGGQNFIGRYFGSTGLVEVDGAGSLWRTGSDIFVGYGGPGSMRITNGGAVICSIGRVGGEPQGALGSVVIDGPGSRWTVNTLSLAGQSRFSIGEVSIANGGMLEQNLNGQGAIIGSSGFGRVVVNGAASRWIHPGTPQLGSVNGAGEVFLENGAQFTSAGADMATGSGRFVVSGPTTRWTSTGQITLGKAQNQASLELLDGATLSLPLGSFVDVGPNGRLILSNGRLLPPSTRFAFTNAGLVQGGGVIQGSGVTNSGRVLVGPGERLQITGRFTHAAAGVIEVNNGELELGSFDSSPGSRVIASGATLRVTGAGSAAIPSNSRGTVTFADGRNRVFGIFTNTGSTIVASGAEAEFYDQVNNLGTMSVASGGKLTLFGTLGLRGVGGGGDVYLEGPVQPAGEMDFGGNVYLGGASRLEIGMNGTAPDSLNVIGDIALSGALKLTAIGELPTPSMMLPIVRAGALSGVFSSTPAIGATIGAGVRFHGVTYDYAHDEVLVSLTQGLAGDLNLDGQLSGLDLLAWQRASGSACEPGMGADANCDGVVDGGDLAVWRSAVAAAAASQGVVQTAVPEPASWLLLVLGLVASPRARRQGP